MQGWAEKAWDAVRVWDEVRAWDVEGAWAAKVWEVKVLVEEARHRALKCEIGLIKVRYQKGKKKDKMKLVDIMPIEKWIEIEQEINRQSGLNAALYDVEGVRITAFKKRANRKAGIRFKTIDGEVNL